MNDNYTISHLQELFTLYTMITVMSKNFSHEKLCNHIF